MSTDNHYLDADPSLTFAWLLDRTDPDAGEGGPCGGDIMYAPPQLAKLLHVLMSSRVAFADAVYDASKKFLFGLDDCDPPVHVDDSSEE